MKLSEELQWRGFVNQTTLKDITDLDTKQFTFYWGVDPSADSMTIGNFSMAMMVRHFIAHGHTVVLLVGGATGAIGDPDGKDEERTLKSMEEVEKNKASIVAEYRKIFAGLPFEVVDNYDWFKDMRYLDFLRDIGKHFSMTQLLDRDFIKSRIGEGGKGISYAEFSYSLIQGYDFLHLYRTKGTTLQVAGADQWGNSISGVELIRKLEGAEAHIWTGPLVINQKTGKKFGKSEEGAIWVSEAKTSVYKFYQFWLNVDDEGVGYYAKLYTLLSKDEVADMERLAQQQPAGREAQKRLAYEVTKVVHGEARANSARKVTEVLFGGTPVSELDERDISMLSAEIPTVDGGVSLIEALAQTGVAASTSEARRLLAGNAVSVNGHKVTNDQQVTGPALVKKGKNSFILVK